MSDADLETCDECGADLEPSQIGLCDACQDDLGEACPNDPDGLHHVGCGCENSDWDALP